MQDQLEKYKARFWARVCIAGPDECWEWLGQRDLRRGYGKFSLGYWTVSAHRFAYVTTYGALPDDKPMVCHRCDVTFCANPRHLFAGDSWDNNHDMLDKGRQARGLRHGRYTQPDRTARGDRNGSRVHPERLPRGEQHRSHTHPESVMRGETHGMAVLTDDDVREIWRLLQLPKPRMKRGKNAEGQAHPLSYEGIARRFGVTRATIYAIKIRRIWRHLDLDALRAA